MKPGVVVIVNFQGVTGIKRMPAVVISTQRYSNERHDVIVALITTKVSKATASSDHILQDWASAGLDRPSAVPTFLGTYPASNVQEIGVLSASDWAGAHTCLKFSLEV